MRKVSPAAGALVISRRALRTAEADARRRYPEECCGILLGRTAAEDAPHAQVTEARPARNQEARDRGRRYFIDPLDLLAAHKAARAAGLEVVGYYHSHPDLAARPSALDAERAWPDTSYLILAVTAAGVTEARSWRLRAEGGLAEEALACISHRGRSQ